MFDASTTSGKGQGGARQRQGLLELGRGRMVHRKPEVPHILTIPLVQGPGEPIRYFAGADPQTRPDIRMHAWRLRHKRDDAVLPKRGKRGRSRRSTT